ncbi:DUF364 domain-containing protein [Candidatus Chlorohelix sp.]|uniref:DUF364 domain-containing protein n=1 Tax=Candidatus Chlorohelix sp. TaxID=3139201 RepID=UPI0030458F5B
MPLILDSIIETLIAGWKIKQVNIGVNWTLVEVINHEGETRAGVAATPGTAEFKAQAQFHYGLNHLAIEDARILAGKVREVEPVQVAIGLATLNSMLAPDPATLADIDAGDWLVENAIGRKVAIVGHFPFVKELEPIAQKLWVLELDPREGDLPASEAPRVIPNADLLAITSSALINHTLEGILALVQPGTKVIMLGPSTPLTPILFKFGVDLLSGVQVSDMPALIESIEAGLSFRKMRGLRRVTLLNLLDSLQCFDV